MTVVVHELPAQPGGPPPATAGTSTRPALLFCHAAGYFGQIWRQVSVRLRLGWPRFAIDFRGHGDAGPLPPSATWQAFRDDVATAAARIRPATLVGIGHSLGGTALLLAEAAQPGTFAALICYEPVLATRYDPRFATAAASRRAVFHSREEALAWFSSKAPWSALDPEVLCDYVNGGFAGQAAGGIRLRCLPATEAQIYRTAVQSGWASALPGIRCRVVILAGARSALMSPESLSFATSALPQCAVVTLRDAGHLGPLERPGLFAGTVDEILAESITKP